MPEDKLAKAGAAYRRARQAVDERHSALKNAVIEAYRADVKTMDIARRTGMDRELIRRIRKTAEDAGLLPQGDK